MRPLPVVPPTWLVDLVNEYGTQPRAVAGESDQPYPDLHEGRPHEAGPLPQADLTGVADLLWPVFAAATDDERAARLTQLLSDAQLTPTVTAGCAVTLLAAVDDGGWRLLNTCDFVYFIEVNVIYTGRARRYCSAICLNRSRVRAYRARQQQKATHWTNEPPTHGAMDASRTSDASPRATANRRGGPSPVS